MLKKDIDFIFHTDFRPQVVFAHFKLTSVTSDGSCGLFWVFFLPTLLASWVATSTCLHSLAEVCVCVCGSALPRMLSVDTHGSSPQIDLVFYQPALWSCSMEAKVAGPYKCSESEDRQTWFSITACDPPLLPLLHFPCQSHCTLTCRY